LLFLITSSEKKEKKRQKSARNTFGPQPPWSPSLAPVPPFAPSMGGRSSKLSAQQQQQLVAQQPQTLASPSSAGGGGSPSMLLGQLDDSIQLLQDDVEWLNEGTFSPFLALLRDPRALT